MPTKMKMWRCLFIQFCESMEEKLIMKYVWSRQTKNELQGKNMYISRCPRLPLISYLFPVNSGFQHIHKNVYGPQESKLLWNWIG